MLIWRNLSVDWLSFNVFRQQVVCWTFDSLILYLYIKGYDILSAKTIHLFVVIDYATWPDIGII